MICAAMENWEKLLPEQKILGKSANRIQMYIRLLRSNKNVQIADYCREMMSDNY